MITSVSLVKLEYHQHQLNQLQTLKNYNLKNGKFHAASASLNVLTKVIHTANDRIVLSINENNEQKNNNRNFRLQQSQQ